jgi:hypothetical protein
MLVVYVADDGNDQNSTTSVIAGVARQIIWCGPSAHMLIVFVKKDGYDQYSTTLVVQRCGPINSMLIG